MSHHSSAGAAPRAASSSSQSLGGLPGRGLAAALGAFGVWGVFPLYLKGLTQISALQITAHRIAWSCVFVVAWMALRGELGNIRAAVAHNGVFVRLAASALLISINWLAFAWAVNNDRVLDVSLGYYVGPLLNVLLGIVVLKERLNGPQWTSVAIASAGVLYLIVVGGHVPWVAFTVGASFGVYGLIRKTVGVDALPGLAVETLLLAPFAVGYLIWCHAHGVDALLVFSGVITAVPLFLFAYGARQIPYSTMGVIQFIAPSLQLACGLVVFGESFDSARAVGFLLIWIALLIYSGHGLWQARARKPAAALTAN
jgi:chloramphenicol-sensitive protein RarD